MGIGVYAIGTGQVSTGVPPMLLHSVMGRFSAQVVPIMQLILQLSTSVPCMASQTSLLN